MKLSPRFSIAGLMGVVLVVSLSLAALRSASATWAGLLYLLTHGILVLAIVGAVCRGPSERAWWLGFALFGLAYLRPGYWFGQGYVTMRLPTSMLLDLIRPEDPQPFKNGYDYYFLIGHSLFSLLFATIGGVLARMLFPPPAGPSPSANVDAGALQEAHPARARWRKPAVIGVGGVVTVSALVFLAPRHDPAFWAGAIYLLTWAVVGMAALGFACGRGRRRMVWFGAAFFGLGYMFLNRGPERFEETSYEHILVDQVLNAVRPWFPPVVSGYPAATAAIAAENLRVGKALDQPVPMQFRDGTTLENLIIYIRAATQAPDGRAITVYVDPIGLTEAEKSLESQIQIELEGLPLSVTLRLALTQLTMDYRVKDGLLFITSKASSEDAPVVDYYLLLGHSFMAMLAAGLGALAVPLVSDRRGNQAV